MSAEHPQRPPSEDDSLPPPPPGPGEFWAVLLAFVQVVGPSILLLLSGFFIVYGLIWVWLNWWPMLFG